MNTINEMINAELTGRREALQQLMDHLPADLPTPAQVNLTWPEMPDFRYPYNRATIAQVKTALLAGGWTMLSETTEAQIKFLSDHPKQCWYFVLPSRKYLNLDIIFADNLDGATCKRRLLTTEEKVYPAHVQKISLYEFCPPQET